VRYIVDIDPRIKVDKAEETWALPIYVVFSGGVTEESARKFREELEVAEAHAQRSKQDIIPVVVDSYGGSVYALLSMVDAINNCKIPVATIVEGKAMSAGAVLFSCGTEGHRYVGPNATVMIHDVSSFAMGKEPELKVRATEAQRLNELIYGIMAKNCGYKDKEYFYNLITPLRGADLFLTPKECTEHKLANKIHIPSMEVKVKLDWKFK
jgi:ATP-dependent Clp protease protease subunit